MKTLKLSLLGIAALVAVGAQAQTMTWSGSLAAGDPTFNRPLAGVPVTSLSGVGTAVRYKTFNFAATQTGAFTIEMSSATFDTFLVVYQTSFTPATPLVNALGADDDFLDSLTLLPAANNQSQLNLSAVAGTNYVIVATAFSNTNVGNFNLAAQAVPEPMTMGLLGLGALAVAARRRRKN